MNRPSRLPPWCIDAPLLWLATFGVWPLADPGHDFDTLASVLDVLTHWAALAALATRWTIVRRSQREATLSARFDHGRWTMEVTHATPEQVERVMGIIASREDRA